MPYKIPWSNFHELNLDWLLEQVKLLRTDVDDMMGAATPSDEPPLANGTANAGSSINYSRGDHVHPTDTSRASASALTTETTDRQDADLALSGRIDTLAARVVPSDAYPLMDGAAESGSHVQYSRRDHRHPTDTSRAAASDLTQEINDRGNADTTLQTNIDAVDAKIKFSSSAPLMDSSSASPGFSDYQARADHVHPTDTSRASQDDFDTLKARVDAFEGSANPSDSTPLMDGVGYAGTGGNYSRGDHVHPSDTSKFDKTGGTINGNVTLTGVLRQNKIQGYATISATGWMRVATVPNNQGNSVDIYVQRRGNNTPAEIHRVSLMLDYTPTFCDEVSKSSEFFIDKIRYTSAGKVDIHIDQNYASSLSVYIEPHTVLDSELAGIEIVNPFDYVPAAPVGETILASFDLTADTEAYTSVSLASVTLNPGDNTVASMAVPAGKHYIEGYMMIRTATQINVLMRIGSSFRQTSKGWANGVSFIVPVSGASISASIYNYETAAATTTEGELLYRFV